MPEQKVGYIGRNDMPSGQALAGILHIEKGDSFTTLCNGQRLSYRTTRERIHTEHGFMIKNIRICKRCAKKDS